MHRHLIKVIASLTALLVLITAPASAESVSDVELISVEKLDSDQTRITAGGVAVIKVGAATEVEIIEKKDRFKDV